MTLFEIRNLVISCDETAQHYWSSGDAKDYTIWQQYSALPVYADNVNEQHWRFQIDRFTEMQFDPIAQKIKRVLDETHGVAYQYHVDFQGTPGRGGLIHHIFDCQG